MQWFGPRTRIAAILAFIAVAAGVGWWYFFVPSTITVSLFPDYAFRQQPDWKARLEFRLTQVSRIYAGQTAIRWKLLSVESEDPINASSAPMDARRTELSGNTHYPADVLLIVTGIREGARTGAVNPFSHAGLVVDFPDRSEKRNTLAMAHEMAHFFGVPREPGSSTIMNPEPNDARFSNRAATLIRRMRRYDFHRGTSALEGAWDARVLAALTEAGRGLHADPVARAHEAMASALGIDRRYPPSLRHLREALKLDPSSTVRMQLALTLVQDTQLDAAIDVLRDGIRADPNDARLHSMLASLLSRRDFEAAVAEYGTAIRLDPNNPTNCFALGTLLTSGMGRIDAAIDAFRKALRLSPGMPQALQGLAQAQQMKENARVDAARRLQQVNAARPDPRLYYALGLAEMRSGDLEAAAKAFGRSIELDPNSAAAYSSLALAHYVIGNYAAALAEASKSKTLGASMPDGFLAAIQAKMK